MQNAKLNKSQMLDVKCQIHILNVKSNKYSREKSQILKSKVQMTNQVQNPKSII